MTDNRKKVNFYKKNIVNYINMSINEYDLHISDSSKDEASNAVKQAIDVNPVLNSLEAFDAVLELKDAKDNKAKGFEELMKSSNVVLKAVDMMVSNAPFAQTDNITQWNEKSEKTQKLLELLSSGGECASYIYGLTDKRKSRTKNLHNCVTLVAKSLNIDSDNEDKNSIIKRKLEEIASSAETLEAVTKLTTGKNKNDVKKALFQTTSAISQVIGDAVVLHYIGTENQDMAIGIESFINDDVLAPTFKVMGSCLGEKGASFGKCQSSISQELGKSMLKVAIPSAF